MSAEEGRKEPTMADIEGQIFYDERIGRFVFVCRFAGDSISLRTKLAQKNAACRVIVEDEP